MTNKKFHSKIEELFERSRRLLFHLFLSLSIVLLFLKILDKILFRMGFNFHFYTLEND